MSTDQVNALPIVGTEPSRSWVPFWTYVGLVLVGAMVSLFFPPIWVFLVGPESPDYMLLNVTVIYGVCSMLAIFYAFSFALPWLWFRNAWARVLLAFMVPMMQWTCFILGLAFADGVSFVSQTPTYLYFATALLFGSIPSISLRWWWRKWQLTAVGEKQVDSRMTIVDLFGLSLVAALILTVVRIAYQSNHVRFVWRGAWLELAISALFGVMVTVIALTSISICLRLKIRLTLANALGIGLTVLLVVSTSVLLNLGGGYYPSNPLLNVVIIALVDLVCMVGTASGIALLLRKSGLRLSTRSDRQSIGR